MEKEIYCTISEKKFRIWYGDETGVYGFNCSKHFRLDGEIFCEDIKLKKCPVYNLLEDLIKEDLLKE